MSSDRRRWKKRAQARDALERIFDQPENVLIIHYSCESFARAENGRSLRIASVAVKHLKSKNVRSFSIHQHAERLGVAQDRIWERFEDIERALLAEFFDYVRSHLGYTWAHWNMRSDNFGFQALEHRARVLGVDAVAIGDDRKIDVSQLMIDIYGPQYAQTPVLVNLAARNDIKSDRFLPGEVEAQLFDKAEFLRLQQSTHKKVDFISYLAERAADQTLKTYRTTTQIVSWNASILVDLLRSNRILQFLFFIGAVGSFGFFCYRVLQLLQIVP